MEIKRTTIITEGVYNTPNARYDVSYTMEYENQEKSAKLQMASAKVHVRETVETPTEDGNTVREEGYLEIGTLSMEFGLMRTDNFPFSDNYQLYIADFTAIINGIINPENNNPD